MNLIVYQLATICKLWQLHFERLGLQETDTHRCLLLSEHGYLAGL